MDLEFEKDCDFVDCSLQKAVARLEELQIEVETNNQIVEDKIRRLARQKSSTSNLGNERSQSSNSPQVDKTVSGRDESGTPDRYNKYSREISPIGFSKGGNQTVNRKNQQSDESPIYRNKDTNEIELNSDTKQKYLDAFGSASSRLGHERYSPMADSSSRSRSPNTKGRFQGDTANRNPEPTLHQRSASSSKLNSSGTKPVLNRPYPETSNYQEAASSWMETAGYEIEYLPADSSASGYNPNRKNSQTRSRDVSASPDNQVQPKLWPEWKDDRPLPVFDKKPKPPGPSEQPTEEDLSTSRNQLTSKTSRKQPSSGRIQARPAAAGPRSQKPQGLRAVPQVHVPKIQPRPDVAREKSVTKKPNRQEKPVIKKAKTPIKPPATRHRGLYREPTFGSGNSDSKPPQEIEFRQPTQDESFGQTQTQRDEEVMPLQTTSENLNN